jgi:hypothetical protein
VDGRRGPLAVEGSAASISRAVILYLYIIDTAENEEDVSTVGTFIFIFHLITKAYLRRGYSVKREERW